MPIFRNMPYTNFHELNLDWLLKKVKEVEDKTTNLEESVTEQVKKLFDDYVPDLDVEKLKTLEADVTENKIKKTYTDLKAIAIGDSYARGVGSNDAHGWAYYLKQYSGMDMAIYGNSQAGFTRSGKTEPYAGMTFITMLNTIAENMTETQRDEISYLFCCGGYNDHSSSYNDVKSATTTFISSAIGFFKNAKIVIIPLSANDGWNANKMNAYVAISNAAKEAGCLTSVVSIWWLYGKTDWVSGDNIHPNGMGYKIQGASILGLINGWSGEFSMGYGGVTFGENVSAITAGFRVLLKNGTVTIQGGIAVTGNKQRNDTLFTLREDLRPNITIYIPAWYFKGTVTRVIGAVRIQKDGKVTIAPGMTIPDVESLSDYEIYMSHSYIAGM